MSKSNNPLNIVVKNQFFPDGLNEQQVYRYWCQMKYNLLPLIEGKEIFFYIAPDTNQTVVRRHLRENELYKITTTTYEKILNGRILGIVSTVPSSTDIGIVDIDINPTDGVADESEFNLAKEAVADTFDFLARNYGLLLFYTGKNGFHIHVKLPKKLRPENIKEILYKQLNDSPLSKRYTLLSKRDKKTPNIDLSINKNRGGYITQYSLNKIGLPCALINREALNQFKREKLVSLVENP